MISTIKCLGVLLDENLSWKCDINELSKKLSRTIGIFYRIRNFVPFEILKLLYYSLFHSFLSYSIAVWGFTYKSHFQKLLILKKKIIKVMTFNKQTAHSTHIFANIQLFKIDDIRQLQLLTFVYDCQNKLAPTYFHHYFKNALKCMVIVPDWHHVVIYFLKGKTHFNMALGQLNIMGQGFGI